MACGSKDRDPGPPYRLLAAPSFVEGMTAATLSQWRDTFLEAGESGLKPHPIKEFVEVGRLREKIGEQAMENELLREKIAQLEQNRPLARGRSRK